MDSEDFIEPVGDPKEPTVGGQYDLCSLTFACWEYDGHPVEKQEALGYHWQSYFDADCFYQGPQEGIYPTFWFGRTVGY